MGTHPPPMTYLGLFSIVKTGKTCVCTYKYKYVYIYIHTYIQC